MAWIGYYTYDGTEIINVERTEAYVRAQNASWGFKNDLANGDLHLVLSEAEYTTPMGDIAPWVDPDRLESYDFWGAYPISVSGIDDSTREATVTEYIRDGGSTSALRHATRSTVFSVALLGAGEQAVEYGLYWLKAALLGRNCSPVRGCNGAEMEFFSSEPIVDHDMPPEPPAPDPVYAVLDGGRAAFEVDDPDIDGGTSSTVFTDNFDGGSSSTAFPITLSEPYPPPFEANVPNIPADPTGCLAIFLRRMKDVKVIDGPEVTAKRYMSDGSCMWTVSFTAVAGDPYHYGRDRLIVDRFLGADTTDPFGPGITGVYDSVGYAHEDVECLPKTWEPLYDPLCAALVPPPGPVDIPAGCFDPETEWWRRYISIPEDLILLWGSSVPIFTVTAQYEDLRQVRIRLYADPAGVADPEADQCEPVADLMVTYVPQGATLVIDGIRQSVYVTTEDGGARRADALVFASDGKPFVWPELTCGFDYLMTVDTTSAAIFPQVDLSLATKAS